MKVKNLISKAGNPVVNQFEIQHNGERYFQSYRSIICMEDRKGQIWLDPDFWNYSRTTSTYRNQFLDEMIATTRKKIESGEYKFKSLNKERS